MVLKIRVIGEGSPTLITLGCTVSWAVILDLLEGEMRACHKYSSSSAGRHVTSCLRLLPGDFPDTVNCTLSLWPSITPSLSWFWQLFHRRIDVIQYHTVYNIYTVLDNTILTNMYITLYIICGMYGVYCTAMPSSMLENHLP